MALRTAELYRYKVGLVIYPSWAFGINLSLESSDKVVMGYGHPDLNNDMAGADGWFLILEPDLAGDEFKIAIYRNGTAVNEGPRESDGTTQTSISDLEGPGGITIGFTAFRPDKNIEGTPPVGEVVKKNIAEDEVAVVWGRAEATDSLIYQYNVVQEW